MDTFIDALVALAPSVGVGLLFWFAIRKVIHADRAEREAMARMDAEEARATRREEGDPAVRNAST